MESLAAKAVQRAALALERVHDVERRDSLAARMLSVGHRVADHVLQEHLEHAARLLIDEAADALDTTAAGQAADGRLGDACRQIRESTICQQKLWHKMRAHTLSACELGMSEAHHSTADKHSRHAPWMLSRRTLRWRLAPPLPRPLPPLPRPDMVASLCGWGMC